VTEPEVVDGRARRIFTLSPSGRERLAAEAERLAATAREETRRLSVERPSTAAT
jgi:hypothetical protein